MAAPVGGSKTVSTSRVAMHTTGTGAPVKRAISKLGPVGGSATTSTGRVGNHVGAPASAPSYRNRSGK